MQITLLGTGGPRPDPDRQGPATLVTVGNRHLLFDAGRGVATQIVRAGVTLEQIDAIFLTHHHFDHTGGLGDLLMATWNLGRTRPLPVYGPPGTERLLDDLFSHIYASDVRFRIREAERLGSPIHPPHDTITGHDITAGTIAVGHDVSVRVGQIEHGSAALGLTDAEWTAVGYRISDDRRTVAVVGDAVAGRDLDELARDADALVISAYLAGTEIVNDDDRFLTEHVLAGAPQAAAIAAGAGVHHLVLTHIREKPDAAVDSMIGEVRARFDGTLTVGNDLRSVIV